jgi:hypothetical protein
MNGHEGRASRTGAWVAMALCCLTGCTGAPETSTGAGGPVTTAVRAATDRSAAQRSVVTLPSGERMRRVTLGTGYNHVLIGRVEADGTRSLACVDNAPAAESFLAPATQGNGQ